MHRRTFAATFAGALASPAANPGTVGLITHEGGPHLAAYVEALAVTPEVEGVAVSDQSGAIFGEVRKKAGAKLRGLYKDPFEMLRKEKPLMALVAMEAALAPPAIDAALDAGSHVLAEKPACERASSFEPLARKADATGRNLVLALANRVDPMMRETRRLVQEGALGKLYGVELHIIADQTRLTRPAYHKTWTASKARAGGGHLIWLGIHWLDLAMYITGSRIRDVAGFAGNVGGQPIDTEDSAAVALRFDNGIFGTITSGYYLDRGYHSMLKIWGSHGWVEVRRHPEPIMEWFSRKESEPKVRRYDGPREPAGYTPFVRHVVRACAGLEAPLLNSGDSLHVLKTCFAAYRSAETGLRQAVR